MWFKKHGVKRVFKAQEYLRKAELKWLKNTIIGLLFRNPEGLKARKIQKKILEEEGVLVDSFEIYRALASLRNKGVVKTKEIPRKHRVWVISDWDYAKKLLTEDKELLKSDIGI